MSLKSITVLALVWSVDGATTPSFVANKICEGKLFTNGDILSPSTPNGAVTDAQTCRV